MWWIKEPENYEIVILNQLWQMKAIYSKKTLKNASVLSNQSNKQETKNVVNGELWNGILWYFCQNDVNPLAKWWIF